MEKEGKEGLPVLQRGILIAQHFDLFLFNSVGFLLLVSVLIGLDFMKVIFCRIFFSNSTLYYSEGKSIYQEQSLLE